nr:hypothetical protein [Tanacetum cinerariifolium]
MSWKEHTCHGRNIHIMEGTYISWKKHRYHGRNIHVMEGTYMSWEEMRIRSPDRFFGFPSGFPLGMVPPKNLD